MQPLHPSAMSQLDRAIAGEIWSEPRAYRNLVEMCDRFGPRFAGRSGYDQAADWIQARLEAFGLRNVGQEAFAHLGWERGEAVLEVVEPYSATFPALALPYSPSAVVEGEIVDLWSAPPEAYVQDQLGDRIVLTSGASVGAVRSMHRTEKYARAVAAGATAFVFANGADGQLLPTGSLAHGRAGEIPGVGVSAETARAVQRWLARGPVRVRLTVRGCAAHRSRSHNVIAELPGACPDGPEVVLCAHLDSHDIAPGAEDNGSGVVSVLEAARALAALDVGLPGAVRVILFGAEEIGLLGSSVYVQTHGQMLERVRMVLNADTTGMPGILVVGLNGWPELVQVFESYAKYVDCEAAVVDHVVPYSDHFPFALAVIPSAMVSSRSYPGRNGYGHTSGDTLDKVSARQLQTTAAALARLTVRILAEGNWPARRPPQAVRDLLIRQGLDEPLRLDGRWPF